MPQCLTDTSSHVMEAMSAAHSVDIVVTMAEDMESWEELSLGKRNDHINVNAASNDISMLELRTWHGMVT